MCELRTIPTCIVYANKLFRMPFRTHCTVHIDWFNFHMFRNISLQSKMCIAKVLMKIEPTKIHTSHLSTCTIPVIYICFDRKSINSKPAYEIDIKIIPKYYALTPKINWLLFLRCDFLFTRLINVFFCINSTLHSTIYTTAVYQMTRATHFFRCIFIKRISR